MEEQKLILCPLLLNIKPLPNGSPAAPPACLLSHWEYLAGGVGLMGRPDFFFLNLDAAAVCEL